MSTVSSIASMKEPGLKALVKRQPLLSMYILLFLLGWSGLILQLLIARGSLSVPSAIAFIVEVVTGWAPGIAAIVVTAVLARRAGVRDLFRRFLIWRVGLQWYLIALFLIAAIILSGIGLHVLFGGAMPIIFREHRNRFCGIYCTWCSLEHRRGRLARVCPASAASPL
jgi:hypothetical protein